MIRNQVVLLCLMQLVILSSSLWAANEEFFVPQWQKGDRWLVKVQRKAVGGTTEKTPRPSLWIFKVVNTRDEHVRGKDFRFFHIMVRSWKTPPTEEAGLLFLGRLNGSRTRVVSLNLVRAAYREGKGKAIERVYNKQGPSPFPVINDISPIPFSFPLFNEGKIVGRVGGKKNIIDMGAMFPVTEKVGTLAFARDVIQKVFFPLPKAFMGIEPLVGNRHLKAACLVTISRPDDNARVDQVWHKRYPWFIFSENAHTRSWLAKVRRNKGKKSHSSRRGGGS